MPLMAPSTYIATYAEQARQSHQPLQPDELDYSEIRGGFACASCRHSTVMTETEGHCALLQRPIHLQDGCCVAWAYDPAHFTEINTV